MSKGIREAPTKALIGDLARQSGDRTEGAFGELPFCCCCCCSKGSAGLGQTASLLCYLCPVSTCQCLQV